MRKMSGKSVLSAQKWKPLEFCKGQSAPDICTNNFKYESMMQTLKVHVIVGQPNLIKNCSVMSGKRYIMLKL